MADLEKQLQKCNPDSVKLIIVDGNIGSKCVIGIPDDF